MRTQQRMRTRMMLCMTLCALASACTVGPRYHRPTVPMPASWSAAPQATSSQDLDVWWRQFKDAQLDQLIDATLAHNLDIAAAGERIAQARAQRDAAAGALWPTLAGKSSFARYGIPSAVQTLPQKLLGEAASSSGGAAAASAVSVPKLPNFVDFYQLGFDASWELDLFGGTRRAVQAAQAQTEAAVAARRGAVVAALAEAGDEYAALRTAQARLQVANHTLQVEQELLQLTESRHDSGMASDQDVDAARSQLDSTRATLPLLNAQLYAAVHALAVLQAQTPEAMEGQLSAQAPIPQTPDTPPVGLPSELLTRRPDIVQAERTAAAATAEVGVSEAARFPTLTLTESGGFESTQLHQWIERSNWAWDTGAALTTPIFEGGRLAANQRAAEAAARSSVLAYRRTVLQALAETEDALRNWQAAAAQLESLRAARAAEQQALERSRDLYRSGLVPYIEVLDADRTVSTLDDQLAQSQGQRMRALIALYQALGGGWQLAE